MGFESRDTETPVAQHVRVAAGVRRLPYHQILLCFRPCFGQIGCRNLCFCCLAIFELLPIAALSVVRPMQYKHGKQRQYKPAGAQYDRMQHPSIQDCHSPTVDHERHYRHAEVRAVPRSHDDAEEDEDDGELPPQLGHNIDGRFVVHVVTPKQNLVRD
jgi:hypothetical protein